MKVKIEFTLDVNEQAWMDIYGIERDEVREDVRTMVEDAAFSHLLGLGLLVQRRWM